MKAGGLKRMTMTRRGEADSDSLGTLSGNEENFTGRAWRDSNDYSFISVVI
jgi:hypothetical protein